MTCHNFAIETRDRKMSNSRIVGDVFVNHNYIFYPSALVIFPQKKNDHQRLNVLIFNEILPTSIPEGIY